MNKNTLLAILLIGAILLGFSFYNNKIAKEQQREQFVKDSIAYQEAIQAASIAQTQAALQPQTDTISVTDTIVASGIYSSQWLNQAAEGQEQFVTLENNKLKVVFNSKGAQPYSVTVKGYKSYSGDSLVLFEGSQNKLSFNIFAAQDLNTEDFYFTPVPIDNDNALTFRLQMEQDAYIEYVYVLNPDDYVLHMNVNLVGMQQLVPKNVTQMGLDWNIDIRHLEKGFDNEKNYSTIVYKYPNTDDVESLPLRKPEASEELKTKVEWVAFQQQFFSAILFSDQPFSSGDIAYSFYDAANTDNLLMRSTAALQVAYDGTGNQTIPLQFYFGPNGFYTLKEYDRSFEQIIPLGGWLIKWINRFVIIPIFNFLNKYISNYGLIILLMTILIKLVISPFTLKSYKSSAKMRVLKPEVDKINAKYPKQEDALKKQQETMALYKKTGVSMMGGCLPMIFQMPILIAMFRFFPGSIELRQEAFLWADDLSGYDSILDFGFKIPLYGNHISLFALLMAVSMFFYQRMTMKQQPSTKETAGMQSMMLYMMPIMMLCICNNLSAALSYYYLLSNLITMIQTWVIQKFFIDEEKLYRQLREKADKSPANQKSKFQLRLEEMQRMQQQQQKQQKRK